MGFFFFVTATKKRERKSDNPENIVVICVTALPHQNVLNVVCAIGECAMHPFKNVSDFYPEASTETHLNKTCCLFFHRLDRAIRFRVTMERY